MILLIFFNKKSESGIPMCPAPITDIFEYLILLKNLLKSNIDKILFFLDEIIISSIYFVKIFFNILL